MSPINEPSNFSDFDGYIRQGEPSQVEKSQIWKTAIGLQQVDGLTPSAYLIEAAKENIEGKIALCEVQYRIDSYYKQQRSPKNDKESRTEEADRVSANIAEILSENTFSFGPSELLLIHKRLFKGVQILRVKGGKIRDYNISKSEWVLNGETVIYAAVDSIKATLDYDFAQEKNFRYNGFSINEKVLHIAKFISGLWQIHAFGEGNTRTIAVFAIKYLRTLGFKVENDLFAEHAWYFRNALVRANFNDHQKKIYATDTFLMAFFGNLLLGESNGLRNRYLHISDTSGEQENQATQETAQKTTQKILVILRNNPQATRKELAQLIGITPDGVKWNLDKLKKANQIRRVGADKGGHWEIIEKAAKNEQQ